MQGDEQKFDSGDPPKTPRNSMVVENVNLPSPPMSPFLFPKSPSQPFLKPIDLPTVSDITKTMLNFVNDDNLKSGQSLVTA